ncbi:unannotated protein [freshwater metagenome]|uniref:Unannotated protein n=1 Tax=freshwater metagenome TaxID=449393 RepID=A0A6J6FYP2_9ZZZZ
MLTYPSAPAPTTVTLANTAMTSADADRGPKTSTTRSEPAGDEFSGEEVVRESKTRIGVMGTTNPSGACADAPRGVPEFIETPTASTTASDTTPANSATIDGTRRRRIISQR